MSTRADLLSSRPDLLSSLANELVVWITDMLAAKDVVSVALSSKSCNAAAAVVAGVAQRASGAPAPQNPAQCLHHGLAWKELHRGCPFDGDLLVGSRQAGRYEGRIWLRGAHAELRLSSTYDFSDASVGHQQRHDHWRMEGEFDPAAAAFRGWNVARGRGVNDWVGALDLDTLRLDCTNSFGNRVCLQLRPW